MVPIWETSQQSPGEPISGVRTLEGSWHPAQLSSITHDRGHPTFNFVCQCLVRSSSSPSFHVARSFPLPLFPYVATSSGGSTTKYIFYSCETYGSRPQSHIRNYHRKILHFSMPRFEPGSTQAAGRSWRADLTHIVFGIKFHCIFPRVFMLRQDVDLIMATTIIGCRSQTTCLHRMPAGYYDKMCSYFW